MNRAPPGLAPGTSVGGRWQVAAFIGRGELGEVYAVRDPLSGQAGALKRFSPELSTHAEAWAVFEQTAKAVTALPSTVFAKRVDSGLDGAPWMVSDRVVWPSLAEQVGAGGALSIERVAAMLDALAPAFDAAHAAGLVHRDIKPDNVFVEPAERPTVHVTDFGAWRLRAALGLPPGWAATPGWLGPDTANPAEASTPRMDIFALGLVVFHALTGRCRFRAAERVPLDASALWAQMLEPIGSASALAAELGVPLDAALDDWFSRALAPRPQERFDSVSAMAQSFHATPGRAGASALRAPSRPGPALQRQLVITPASSPAATAPRPTATAPPPVSANPGPPATPPPSDSSLHEPVAMVSAQPIAYLRMPTRPPPPQAGAAPAVPPAPASAPQTAAPARDAPPPVPADAAPTDEELVAFGLPQKRNPVLLLAIAGGVLAIGGLILLGSHLLGAASPAPDGSAATASSTPVMSPAPAPSASRQPEAAPAKPARAVVRFECKPGCERIECDGHEVALDGGSAPLDPGPHRCTATRRGYLPVTDRFRVEPGQDTSRPIHLVKLRPARHRARRPRKHKPCGTFINPCP